MNALATFIMRGPLQAILLVVVTGALSLILPPLSVMTGGVVALVTLRKGAKAGALVLAGASLILGFFAFFAMPSGSLMFAFLMSLIVTIVPVWILAVVLRTTISLAKTFSVAVIMGAVAIIVAHLVLPDPAAWWEEVLSAAIEPAISEAQLGAEGLQFAENIKAMSVWMTGLVAAAMTTSFLASLLIGRWMQALLYNPGGFKEEFQGLRLGRELAVSALITLVVAFAIDGGAGGFAQDLLWVFGAVYILPGLSVIHHWIGSLSKPTIWLVATYTLLLFVPQVAVVLAVVGLVDTWVNIRVRFSKGKAER